MSWKLIDDGRCWVREGKQQGAPRVIGFDYDGTLVSYVRGRKIDPQTDPHSAVMAAKLRKILEDGEAEIMIVSNRSDGTMPVMIEKFITMLGPLGAGVRVYAACGRNSVWRKPHTKSWRNYLIWRNPQWRADADTDENMFVGDAAGRKGDHSAADLFYAHNCGLKFETVEQFLGDFLNPAPIPVHTIPLVLRMVLPPMQIDPPNPQLPTLWVMVGSPASGKSTAAKRLGCQLVGGDLQGKDWERQLDAALHLRQAVAVDATNPSRANRAKLITKGRAAGYHTCIVHMQTDKATCVYLNEDRIEKTGVGVPIIAINTYWARLDPPVAEECDTLIKTMAFATPDAKFPFMWDTK